MRQLTFINPGILEWWDVPEPKIEAPILRGEAPFRGPFAFGHEFVAEVAAVGEAVLKVQVGQRVVVPFNRT